MKQMMPLPGLRASHLIRAVELLTVAVAFTAAIAAAIAQGPDFPPPPIGERPPGFDGPPGFGGPGRGGPGIGGVHEKQKLVKRFDKDGDKRLNASERQAAFEFLQKEQAEGRGRRGPGGPGGRGGFGGRGENQGPAQPGPRISAADVKQFPGAALYDPKILRTFFLEFDDANWEKQMSAFKNTDIEIPARLTVDGKTYSDVGVHFRGASSFMMVGEGRKRSLNLSLDFVHKDQQIAGYRTLELLNSHDDPSFLRTVLSLQIARDYIPAPKANFARVVINGESWGIFVNAQAFNKDFVNDAFATTKGARWKVPGSPNGQGSLKYLGDDVAPYKKLYEIKSKDDAKSWADLIKLCRVLNETPADQLEEALSPLLDIDGALKFLALENVLINNDGYWVRSSDYSIYQDVKGRFHIVPHDSNETFSSAGGPGFGGGPGGRGGFGPGRGGPLGGPGPGNFEAPHGAIRFADAPPSAPNELDPPPRPSNDQEGPRFRGMRGGPGFGGGPGGRGVELDPLVGANDASKPLISKLLAVPSLRKRYLGYVREIAEKWLDWNKLGPIAEEYRSLIAEDVKADTRKLDSNEAFLNSLSKGMQGGGFGPRGGAIGVKNFADQRRAYLLNHTEVKKLERH